MKRKELYCQIFTHILSDYSSIPAGDIQDEIYESINFIDFETARNDFHSNDSTNIFNSLLNAFLSSDEELGEDIPIIDNIKFEVFSGNLLKNKRSFILYEQDLTVFNIESLFYQNTLINLSNNPVLFRAIEKICVNEENMKQLFEIISSQDVNKYVLMYSNTYTPNSPWDLYSFALYKYLNEHKIQIDSSLTYSLQSPLIPTLNFDPQTEYRQYFDIYDVLNEWQHSNNLITCFLKMYHILEFMIYRKGLVEISNGATLKNSFIRQVKGLEKKEERSTFTKEFPIIFNGIAGSINRANINQDVKIFIESYFEKSRPFLDANYSTPDKALANLIYDIRCSIVHNKESEFHITYTNLSDYIFLIPIFKDILNIMKIKIMDLINKPNAVIKFADQNLTLYY